MQDQGSSSSWLLSLSSDQRGAVAVDYLFVTALSIMVAIAVLAATLPLKHAQEFSHELVPSDIP